MAFINPLTVSFGAKVATNIAKKYGPKVLAKLKDMKSKKNLTENLILLGYGSTLVARLMVKPNPEGGKAEEIKRIKKEASEKFASKNKNNKEIVGEPEKPFKETKKEIKMDAKEIKKLNRGGLVFATKYFKHKVNKDN